MGTSAAGMNHALGDALVVEAVDLIWLELENSYIRFYWYTFSRPKGSSSNIGPVLSSLATVNQ